MKVTADKIKSLSESDKEKEMEYLVRLLNLYSGTISTGPSQVNGNQFGKEIKWFEGWAGVDPNVPPLV